MLTHNFTLSGKTYTENTKGPVTTGPNMHQCLGKCEVFTKVGWIQPKSAFNNAPEKYPEISIRSFHLSLNGAF